MIDFPTVLARLAGKRPIFHSEADFQDALAWELHQEVPDARVRLEYRPFTNKSMYIDVWLVAAGVTLAIELKYLTRKLVHDACNETFSLRDQGAQDISRYDVIKDIVRVERVVGKGRATQGYVVVLTNDQGYWQQANTTLAPSESVSGRERGESRHGWAGGCGSGRLGT